MIWRRLLVKSNSTISDLHYSIQIAMGWDDEHLNQFIIRGKSYGVYHDGGISFSDNSKQVHLNDFQFRPQEKFTYEYNSVTGKPLISNFKERSPLCRFLSWYQFKA